ncbi:nuclear transport factor 2 family protein [Paenibacillus sp. ACRSA]|uniref:nuclear transport factor 2 family protein n=1 Tax=Paenibacillus sp. ACRSA TaxID=2918211 RepID=UPI001EF453B9|nr:nuclear transport factor 2 family protein [Paenibacillus sp. ACRSA]MCG7378564.1 nuclear transport factor 2 family protein [Paenibacillus sp. ACRSA]
MSLEILQAKSDLRNLIDSYATLTDAKKVSEQMLLFTTNARFKVYFGDQLVSDVTGTKQLEEEFNGHVALVKRYFTTNAQHVVQVDGDSATGVVFSQVKMVRDEEGQEVLTDYSVQYHDVYIRQDEKWYIQERKSHYIIVEARPLQG